MRESLPPEAFAPFIDEIKKREKQRKERARKVFLFLTTFQIPTSIGFYLFPIVSI